MPLLERSAELDAIERGMGAAREGSGSVVLIEGAPGLGKTSLLAEAAAQAGRDGRLVLRAAGAQVEQDLAWTVARDTFATELRNGRRESLFEGSAGACRSLFDGASVPADGAEAAAAILHGLYWLASELSSERTVALLIDDLQWVDAASQRWLTHLAARVRDLPVCLVAAVRDIGACPTAGAMAGASATSVRRLAALSLGASSELVVERVGGADERLCAACYDATGGNPFLLSELLRDLQGSDVSAIGAVEVSRRRPETIRRAAVARLAELGDGPTRLAQAVTVLGQQASLSLTSRLAALDDASAAAAADALARVGVLKLDGVLAFVHPLMLEAVSSEIGDAQRAELHRCCAELLAAHGADASVLAPHLLHTDPRGAESSVATLRSAAQAALARGAAEAAATYLTRALAEPPSPALRGEVLFDLGRAQGRLAMSEGVGTLRAAFDACEHAERRARVAVELADQLLIRGEVQESADVCLRAARELPVEDRDLRLTVIAAAVTARGQALDELDGEGADVDPFALEGATAGERALMSAVAYARVSDGVTPMPELVPLAVRALRGTALLEDLGCDSPQFWGSVMTLLCGERYAHVAEMIEAGVQDSRRRGSPHGRAFGYFFECVLAHRTGRLARSVDSAQAAMEGFANEPLMGAYARALLTLSLIDQGEYAAARGLLPAAVIDALPRVAAVAMLRCIHGRLLLREGDPGAASRALLIAGEDLGATSRATWPWKAEAATALHHAGERAPALEVAELGVAEARDLQVVWTHSGALRALALTSGELEPLREAEELTRGDGALLERSHVLVEYGAALRRAGRGEQAGAMLRDGLDLAEGCGARPLAALAVAELKLLGARPRRRRSTGRDALTPAELRVCEMAAAGQSNRVIAQTLFVSLRTVETHLTHSYGKLSVEGRSQLAAALTHEPD